MILGLFSSPTPYKGQKYEELKKQAIASGQLFTDPEFPANEKALFRSGGRLSGIEWKRPKASKLIFLPHLNISPVNTVQCE